MVMEMDVTDLMIKTDPVFALMGTSESMIGTLSFQLVVDTENQREDESYNIVEENTQIWLNDEVELEFQEGIAYIDMAANEATAQVLAAMEESLILFVLNMSAAPVQSYNVVVENAIISEQEGGFHFMNGTWSDGETTYPVQAEIPGFDATVASATYLVTITVGDLEDENGPWLGFGEGEVTVTVEDGVVTLTGYIENAGNRFAANVTISGKLSSNPTDLENNTITIEAAKVIRNGQLIIRQGDVEFNAQGAILK
jgi:uncharacterized protein YueI